jgi:hypothetical protein
MLWPWYEHLSKSVLLGKFEGVVGRKPKTQSWSNRATKRLGEFKEVQGGGLRLKRDGTHAKTRFRLSPKRTSPFKSAGASVQSTAGSRGVRISGRNAGYTKFRGSVRVLATHSIRQFSLHFPSRASPCAIRFQTHSKSLAPNSFHNFFEQQHAQWESDRLLSTTTFRYVAQLVCQSTVSFSLQQIKLTR